MDAAEDQWLTRWQDYIPVGALVLLMVMAWVSSSPRGMSSWGVSAAALAHGRYETLLLHMFAHGGLLHLLMNSLGLLEVGGLVTARLGGFAKGWVRMMIAFVLAGFSSVILFLSFHPEGRIPMVGASGAIYGLVGLLLSMRIIEEVEFAGLSELPSALLEFVKGNLLFLLMMAGSLLLAGFGGGIAWEAHLGGFLLGVAIGPWLLPRL